MDPAYASLYGELYRRHWWWRAREARLLALLRRLAPPTGFGRILDVGCGDGLFFAPLRPYGDPEGVEPDVTLLAADGPYRDRIHAGPFDRSFAPDRRFGLILMLDVLEHLDEPRAALEHAASLLAPRGRLLVTVPAFGLLWTSHDELNHHRRRFTRRSLRELAAASGVRLFEARYFFHWLFPAKLLVRLAEAVGAARGGAPRVPPAPLNGLLYGLCRLEQATWGRLAPPFGSSLLAVGGAAER